MSMGMHGNNHPQGKRTVILMAVVCLVLHLLLIPVWTGYVFGDNLTEEARKIQELRKNLHKHHPDGSYANVSKPMVCGLPDVIRKIVADAGEIPVQQFGGVSPNVGGTSYLGTIIVLGFNPITRTWSLVEFIDKEWACIIANGIGVEAVTPSNSTDI